MTTEIVKMGVLNLIVCSDEVVSAAEAYANAEHPAGTTNGWHLANKDDGSPDVVACERYPSRRHMLLEC